MTARANSLTERAREPVSHAGYTWGMPANDMRAFMNAFGRLGYNVDWLLESARLGYEDLNDPDARISCQALGAVLSSAQQQRFTTNPALEIARATPMGA